MSQVETLNALRTRSIGALALALGLFHLANVSGLLVLSTMVVRAVHLTVMLSLIFLLAADPAASGRRKERHPVEHPALLRGDGHRHLPVGPLGGHCVQRRRHDGDGHRGGRHDHPPCGGGGAAGHRQFPCSDHGGVPGLPPGLAVDARRPVRPRCAHRERDFVPVPLGAGHLRDSDRRGVHLHHPVYHLRRLSLGVRRRRFLFQVFHGIDARHDGRFGQDRGRLQHPVGHDFRFRGGQCRRHRIVHDPGDEARGLPAAPGRRHRGGGVDRGADHAAGDGRGRLHHGGNRRHALRQHHEGRAHARPAVLRLGTGGRSSSGAEKRHQARRTGGQTASLCRGRS